MRMRSFLALIRPHGRTLLLAAVLLPIGAAVPGLAVVLLRGALDAFTAGDLRVVGASTIGFVALYAVHALAQVARAAATRQVSLDLASTLRRRLHATFLAAPPSGGVGDRLSALLDEVDQVQYGVSALVTAFRNPITLAVLVCTAGALAPRLVLPALGLLSLAGGAAAFGGRAVRRATKEAREARAALARLTAEQLAGLSTIRAFDAGADETARFETADGRDARARWWLDVSRAAPAAGVGALSVACVAALLWLGAREIAADRSSPATVIAAVTALVLASRPLAGLSEVWGLLQRSLEALARVEEAVAAREARSPRRGVTPRFDQVALVGVGVAASAGRGRDWVIRGIHFEANHGEIVALVGPTGAGKTTILEVLAGTRPTEEGTAAYDGVALANVDERTLQTRVALLPQEPFLFGRSVTENVALGSPPDDRRVSAALLAAGAAFVSEWPEGPSTRLDEAGRTLSGGERQRLCLARALYRASTVLLLDEPTAQLDEATSQALVATFEALRSGRILVIATHDPVVWRAADRIVRVRDGRLEDVEPASRGGGAWASSSTH